MNSNWSSIFYFVKTIIFLFFLEFVIHGWQHLQFQTRKSSTQCLGLNSIAVCFLTTGYLKYGEVLCFRRILALLWSIPSWSKRILASSSLSLKIVLNAFKISPNSARAKKKKLTRVVKMKERPPISPRRSMKL